MLQVINFIKQFGLLELSARHHINIVRSSIYPELIQLKYDQIKTDFKRKVPRECRGLILNDKTLEVVAWPYHKFWNYGESFASRIDWESARVMEKLDGSLMILYYYNDQWNVASSGSPDASGNVGNWDITFNELFWKTWEELGYNLPDKTNYTFMFELLTPMNQIVVRQVQHRIVLHGIRNNITGQKLSPTWAKTAGYNWEIVKEFEGEKSLDYVVTEANKFDGTECEGFVVRDRLFNRIKVKSEHYLRLHRLKSNVNVKNNLIAAVTGGEAQEILAYLPEFTDTIKDIEYKLGNLIGEIEKVYSNIKEFKYQKDFAIEAVKHNFSGILFNMRKNDMSAQEAVNDCRIEYLKQLIGE